jgi:hypothetical protein
VERTAIALDKKSRIQLNDRELLEFWEYLKEQKGE